MLYAIVGMLVIILDQGVKYWVTNNIMLNTVTEPLIPGILSLVRIHNDGAAFSFLAGGEARIYFIILTGIFTVAVIVALATRFISGRLARWCLVLVTAGGLSNCLDRVLYGFVVDMFKVDLFNFAIFNVADVFITVFALLFIICMIFSREPHSSRQADEFDEEDDEYEERPSMRGALREEMSDRKAARTERALRDAEERAADKRSDRRAAKYEYEDEYEDEDPKAARRARRDARREEKEADREAKRAGRRGGKTLYEEDFEQFQSQRTAGQTAPARSQRAQRGAEGNDPFAAWEKANASYESRQSSSATARAMGVSRPAPAAPAAENKTQPSRPTGIDLETDFPMRSPQRAQRAQRLEEAPTEYSRPAAPAARPVASPAPAPAARPAAAPAPAPKAQTSEDEFNLDDILAEFR